MVQPSEGNQITAKCPACGQSYRVGPHLIGKPVRCAKCQGVFKVAPPGAAVAGAAAAAGQTVCPVCQCPVSEKEELFACPDCRTPYHRDCWEYNKGCGVYGCSLVPQTEHLESTEIPVSYWGKEEKNCPVCSKVILAAATRCRYCGATFESARPETATEFDRRAAVEKNLPSVRRTALWLLVFSIISCTAPLAAIFGSIWYAKHRQEIEALPSLHAALCKIAVGLAVGQTVLFAVMGVLYGLFSG
jgi:predicted Zn finger-like uncharacterized protein